MIYPNESFYVLGTGFGVGTEGHMGSFGFSIGLDPKFAKRFYQKEMTEEHVKNINSRGKETIRSIFDYAEDFMIDTPYHFLRNEQGKRTLLLQYCQVLGNACDLGIDGMELGRIITWDKFIMNSLIEYTPHNVDSLKQASVLLTIWNNWAISAYASTSKDE